jgi:acyl-CoA synthetase (AMP-forming)/AMP-acid ligase II
VRRTQPVSFEEVWIPEGVVPLGQVLLRSAGRAPDHEALVFPDARFTYRELAARAWEVARALSGLGIQPREHVGVLMTNHPDLVATVFGAALIGATVVPINARYRTTEIHSIVEDSDVVAILTHDSADEHVDFTALLHDSLPGLREAADPLRLTLPEHPKLRTVVMMGSRTPDGMVGRDAFIALGEILNEERLQARVEGVSLRDYALMLYTSGTTSQPRGAMITHEAFVRSWIGVGGLWHTTPEDRHYTSLPLFHVTALGCLTWVLAAGATFFSDYSFDAGRTLTALEHERITEFYPAYQPVMEGVLAHPGFAQADLSALRIFQNVAPPEVLDKFQKRIPHAIQLTCYGGTEGGVVSMTRPEDPPEVRANTCGLPQPGVELRVIGEDGEPLGPRETGIIEFRGFNTLSYYWKSPEKTAASIREDGWTTMQDLGVLDEAGRVLFLGRQKETLKVGGENVAPQEVEAQLSTHPAVKLVQVVGIPHERLLEVVAAYVELVPGREATEEELIEHCRGRIASFKVPRLIRFIDGDEWPMSATKIQRFKLRERLLAELENVPDAVPAPS